MPGTRCAPSPAPRRRATLLEGLPVDYAAGDLTDAASVGRAVRGCDAVIHCAADYRIWVPDPDAMRAVNVEGTRAVMRAALAESCRRVVHVSSVATLKPRSDGVPATEADAARAGGGDRPLQAEQDRGRARWSRRWSRARRCRR